MSSKSAVKLVAGDGEGQLYRWVAWLTGSKNALKGVGFFLGSLLLTLMSFPQAVAVLMGIVGVAMVLAAVLMRGDLGKANKKAKFSQMLSRDRRINLLSIARFFLFGARDVWFVVALPVFLSTVLGWKFWQTGGFMALWVICYGAVQAAAPMILKEKHGGNPDGKTATWLAFGLALIPLTIAVLLGNGVQPTLAVVGGLLVFGAIFALNSAVHSYLILAYADHDKVAMNVGIYYMANACGRLIGTILSGWLYQIGISSGTTGGLIWCLAASSIFLFATGLLSLGLGREKP
jgi:hypothetical protein